MQTYGCDAPDVRIEVPATELSLGSSDWEAQGAAGAAPAPRTVRVGAFRVDAFEATQGRWRQSGGGLAAGAASTIRAVSGDGGEPARAATGMTRAEASAYCRVRSGRLPTEDEWIVAAASAASPPRRYPWGDTGAVCRRAAWGLKSGPCSTKGNGPDTVGAHDDGVSPLGLHDLAGNVAEWVAPAPSDDPSGHGGTGLGIVKGGSWQSSLAADLRVWARVELPTATRRNDVGVRCVYPP